MYFLNNGLIDTVDYYIIINGISTVTIPKKDNIKIFYRENKGYDFGAYSYVINMINLNYDYYFFMNTSVIGPFIDKNENWILKFLDLFKNDVKIVGTSINIYKENIYGYDLVKLYSKKNVYSHIQSMFFVIDYEYFIYLKNLNFFDENILNKNDFNYVIANKEIGLSQIALNNRWNINCILDKYRDLDYRILNNDINNTSRKGDPYYRNAYFGKTIKNKDVIFYKTNRL